MKNYLYPLLIMILLTTFGCKQKDYAKETGFKLLESEEKVEMTILQYNVENLFDTKDDFKTNDNEFTPKGYKYWTDDRYQEKLNNLGKVISKIPGDDLPAIINLNEIENYNVVKDLIDSRYLKNATYSIVHYEDYDPRGIENAIIYDHRKLKVLKSKLLNKGEHPFRKPLFVRFLSYTGDTLNVISVHLPSRRGGQNETNWKRVIVVKSLIKSLNGMDICNQKSIVMGDFNDEAFNESLQNLTQSGMCFYNPSVTLKKNEGTIVYRGKAQIFDHILVNQSIKNRSKLHFEANSLSIYNPGWIRYKNKPNRSYVGNKYVAGYSDHFPVYMRIVN